MAPFNIIAKNVWAFSYVKITLTILSEFLGKNEHVKVLFQ